MIHSLKYLRSPTLKCKDLRIRKSEFVTKTQFLYLFFSHLCVIDASAEESIDVKEGADVILSCRYTTQIFWRKCDLKVQKTLQTFH